MLSFLLVHRLCGTGAGNGHFELLEPAPGNGVLQSLEARRPVRVPVDPLPGNRMEQSRFIYHWWQPARGRNRCHPGRPASHRRGSDQRRVGLRLGRQLSLLKGDNKDEGWFHGRAVYDRKKSRWRIADSPKSEYHALACLSSARPEDDRSRLHAQFSIRQPAFDHLRSDLFKKRSFIHLGERELVSPMHQARGLIDVQAGSLCYPVFQQAVSNSPFWLAPYAHARGHQAFCSIPSGIASFPRFAQDIGNHIFPPRRVCAGWQS